MKAVIFDLDDTLCDWRSAQNSAIYKINEFLALEQVAQDRFWDDFHGCNPGLYSDYISGRIDRTTYRLRRFEIPLMQQQLYSEERCVKINSIFVDIANGSVILLPGVNELLESLRIQRLKVGLLTNGPSDGQRRKLEVLGISGHFHAICISEEIGIGKPLEGAFSNVCKLLQLEPQDCIMVGDSWDVDIAPALNLGMKAYWVSATACDTQAPEILGAGSIAQLVEVLKRCFQV